MLEPTRAAEYLGPARHVVAAGLRCEPPPWVFALLGSEPGRWGAAGDGLALRLGGRASYRLVSARLERARHLDGDAFASRTTAVYDLVAAVLGRLAHLHVLRLWNFVPGILDPLGGLPHRYMVFNRGRYQACARWCDGHGNFERRLATASAVGHDGESLVVHALAGPVAGVPVENPRQVPAYRYSRRYGPLPPCFARATLLTDGERRGARLLIGGTASVRGEDTVGEGCLEGQLAETLANLRAVVESAAHARAPGADRSALVALREVRVYYVSERHRATLAQRAPVDFPAARLCELVRADLCRPELLVEIEALAEIE